MFATAVIQGCVLKIFGVEFPIDLVPIAMGDVCVVLGMDWLSRFGAMIHCGRQMVMIRDPSGGVLTIYGEGTRSGSAFCLAARARQSLQQGCMGFLVYVSDTRDITERLSTIAVVLVVSEFPDVFLEEIPGVPLERQVEFYIDLLLGAPSVALCHQRCKNYSHSFRSCCERDLFG